jgi:hypothetical protein
LLQRFTTWKIKFNDVLESLFSSNINITVVWTFYSQQNKEILTEHLKTLKSSISMVNNYNEFYFDVNKSDIVLNKLYFNHPNLLKERLIIDKKPIVSSKHITQHHNNLNVSTHKSIPKLPTPKYTIVFGSYPKKYKKLSLFMNKHAEYSIIGDSFLDFYLYYYINKFKVDIKQSKYNSIREQLLAGEVLANVLKEIIDEKKNIEIPKDLNDHSLAEILECNVGMSIIENDNTKLHYLLYKIFKNVLVK